MSTPTPPRPEQLIGCTVADRYQIEAAIGDGGMATVYRATQVHLRRPVALKVLKSRYCDQPDSVERFVREARAASAIRSPYVVDILDVGEITGTTVYIAMELLEGPTLEQLLVQESKLEWSRARRLALQIVRGLRAVHDHNIVHRDIKPSNCMIVQDDRGKEQVKILDFGIAKLTLSAADHELTQTGAIFGTAKYMSPEQARGKTVDARTDIYAFGVILFEMLAGKVPFDGDNFPQVATQHVRDQPPSLEELELPDGVEALIQRCLAKLPEDRFPSMQVLEETLSALPDSSAAPTLRPNHANHAKRAVPEGTVVLKDGGLPANYPRVGNPRAGAAVGLSGARAPGASTREPTREPGTLGSKRQPVAGPSLSAPGSKGARIPEKTLVIGASPSSDPGAWTTPPSGARPGGSGAPKSALPLALASAAVILVAFFAWWSVQDAEVQELAQQQKVSASAVVAAASKGAASKSVGVDKPKRTPAAAVAQKTVAQETVAQKEVAPKAGEQESPDQASTGKKEAQVVATKPEPAPEKKRSRPTKSANAQPNPGPAPRKVRNLTELSTRDIKRSLSSARRLVRAKCGGPGLRLAIKVELEVRPDGKLAHARALPPFDRSDVGSCVVRYARLARFPARKRDEPSVLIESFALGGDSTQ